MFMFLMRANYANEGQSDEMGMCTRIIWRGKTYYLIRTVDTQLTV
jgi:hypothetical protein